MVPTWYDSPQKVAALDAAASLWHGTPWRLNSAVCGRGGGVSCSHHAAEMYFASGYMVRFALPADNLRALILGLGPTLRQHFPPEIVARFTLLAAETPLLPGDLISLRESKHAIHLGVVLADRRFVHVLHHSGVRISSLDDATYSTALVEAFRPSP